VSVEIVEIMGRSEQGVTRPFICGGDDGHVYFVKGRGAGTRSLICEWIAGQLGRRLRLPIAPFEIVEVRSELLDVTTRTDIADLGAGLAFGSRKLQVVELSASHVQYVPNEQQRDVLVFDWWVQNADRTLGETGGNPNLFWDVEEEKLVVIDHNQAFDKAFVARDFVDTHAFRHQLHAVTSDWVLQKEYVGGFESAMTDWTAICDTVPPEWWFVDPERTVPTDFDREAACRVLMRFQADGFWSWK
jgi:hypothetical protein